MTRINSQGDQARDRSIRIARGNLFAILGFAPASGFASGRRDFLQWGNSISSGIPVRVTCSNWAHL